VTNRKSAVPVDASTVVLVREGEPVGSPWQCYMIRRPIRSEFAADVFVFPGGKVDPPDRDPALGPFIHGHPAPEDNDGDSDGWWSTRVAAIRELYEEAGVALLRRADNGLVRFDDEALELDWWRERLQHGQATLLDMVKSLRLLLSVDRLHPFSRWITPETFPRRYDTRFFVAWLPKGQEPVRDPHETAEGVWISPEEALAAYRAGSFPLVFATERNLERMRKYRSIDEMVSSTILTELEPVMPRVVQHGTETAFLVPGDEGY
jgi:8-oxo-dGTP pyrophosphatase MutT (NUDIX family)